MPTPDRPTPAPTRIAVLGAGAWGTTIALVLARLGHDVRLWARQAEQATLLEQERRNTARLPGIVFPEALRVTPNIKDTHHCDLVFLVVPSSHVFTISNNLPTHLPIVNCAKGLDEELRPLSSGFATQGFARIAALSGPNLAHEIAQGLPATSVVASKDAALATTVQNVFVGSNLRVYRSNDLSGVELGGALKNVLALGTGLVDGLGLGENARAALMTRGLREITRFATAHGALEETIYGLAGLGDVLLTCAAKSSRNRSAGEAIARGLPLETNKALEGIPTAARVAAWAQQTGQDLPIIQTIARIVAGELNPKNGVALLMSRAQGAE